MKFKRHNDDSQHFIMACNLVSLKPIGLDMAKPTD